MSFSIPAWLKTWEVEQRAACSARWRALMTYTGHLQMENYQNHEKTTLKLEFHLVFAQNVFRRIKQQSMALNNWTRSLHSIQLSPRRLEPIPSTLQGGSSNQLDIYRVPQNKWQPFVSEAPLRTFHQEALYTNRDNDYYNFTCLKILFCWSIASSSIRATWKVQIEIFWYRLLSIIALCTSDRCVELLECALTRLKYGADI